MLVLNKEVATKKRRVIMAEQGFVWVKEFVCHIEDLKDPKKVSDEDLKNCMDDASRAINIGD